MVYRIPSPGQVIPSQKAAAPRFLDAAIQQQAQANALREAKETDKANKLGAAVSLIGSAGGKDGWMSELGGLFGGEDAPDMDASQGDTSVLEKGQMLSDNGDAEDALTGAASVASLMSGNPMGLIGLSKLFT